jgi:hemoglobin-like flavoprotein
MFLLRNSSHPFFFFTTCAQIPFVSKSVTNIIKDHICLKFVFMVELRFKPQSYGVQPHMYRITGRSLIATLKQMLGERFAQSTQAAWDET